MALIHKTSPQTSITQPPTDMIGDVTKPQQLIVMPSAIRNGAYDGSVSARDPGDSLDGASEGFGLIVDSLRHCASIGDSVPTRERDKDRSQIDRARWHPHQQAAHLLVDPVSQPPLLADEAQQFWRTATGGVEWAH
jgi:hypothetical protein